MALLAQHVVSLIRTRLRGVSEPASAAIAVAGPGGLYDVLDVRLVGDEVHLEIIARERRPTDFQRRPDIIRRRKA